MPPLQRSNLLIVDGNFEGKNPDGVNHLDGQIGQSINQRLLGRAHCVSLLNQKWIISNTK